MAYDDHSWRAAQGIEGEAPSSGVGQPGLSRKLALARLALWWEGLWPALWPLLGLTGLFIALALLDFFTWLPAWLHSLCLAALVIGLLAGCWHLRHSLLLPPRAAAQRRLEQDSALAHRPLEALGDQMASNPGDPASIGLWRLHRQRLLQNLGSLKVSLPRSYLPYHDPMALRSIVVLLLVAGVVFGGQDWQDRLVRAASPQFASAAALPGSYDVWINPPAYTGLPPLFLDPARGGNEQEAVPIAIGSRVLAQVQGEGRPVLRLDEESLAFEAFAPRAYKLEAEIQKGSRIELEVEDRSVVSWPIAVIPDHPPHVVFPEAPGRSERLALRLPFEAHDDYAVTELAATLRRIDRPEETPIELELALPGGPTKDVAGHSYHDLTPHPWAGLAVEIVLTAKDAIGQTAESGVLRTVLPERIFNHPVARALVEQRRNLTLAPEDRLPVVRALRRLGDKPEHFFHDIVVALSIYTAGRRLVHDGAAKAVPEVQQLLWDTALRIEEGELAIAERDLRDIQAALMEALAEDADDAEIEQLLDDLQAALDNFLEALAEQMRQQMANGEQPQSADPGQQQVDSQDLREMIERAREMARSGSREAAQDLLAQLQDMLENLRAQPFAQNQMSEEMQDAHRMMESMESLMQDQQELLDRSFKRSRDRSSEQNSEENTAANQSDGQSQEALRQQLGDLMRQLGEMMGDIPQSLGQAEQEMRRSRDALEGQSPGDSIEPQTRTLDHLQQGMNSMAENFMQMFSEQNQGSGDVSNRPGQGMGRDPLGRGSGSGRRESMQGVEIPDEMEIRRSREILDELRRRRGEPSRPPLELDYIDRLLRQF